MSFPGPTSAPGWTRRSVTTPSNGAVIFRYASRSCSARTAACAARVACCREFTSALRGVHLFFRLDQFVARHRARRLRGLLHAVAGALCGGELRFGLQPVRVRGLHFGLAPRRSARPSPARVIRPAGRPASPRCRGPPARVPRSRGPWRARSTLRNGRNSPGRSTVRDTVRDTTGARPLDCAIAARTQSGQHEQFIALHNIGSRDPSDSATASVTDARPCRMA